MVLPARTADVEAETLLAGYPARVCVGDRAPGAGPSRVRPRREPVLAAEILTAVYFDTLSRWPAAARRSTYRPGWQAKSI